MREAIALRESARAKPSGTQEARKGLLSAARHIGEESVQPRCVLPLCFAVRPAGHPAIDGRQERLSVGAMTHKYVEIGESRNHVARLTLRREEKKNALCMALRDELEEAFAGFAKDPEVHAVVLTGGAGIFCAGFDLKEGQATGGKAFLHRFREFMNACYLFPKVLVATVDGPVLAGGFDLALAADFIVASTARSWASAKPTCPASVFSSWKTIRSRSGGTISAC